MTGKDRPQLTGAQLEIMDVVWSLGEATVAEVWERLCRTRPRARNTVQTTMARLQEKGWLRTRREGHTDRYAPTTRRRKALGQMVRRLVTGAFRGSAEELVSTLIDARKPSDEELARIRRLLEDAERRSS